MQIEVTQSDIRNGLRDDCQHCPIALAAFRATGQDVEVSGDQITVGVHVTDLPAEAREFVANFDLGHPVWPFVFDLPVRQP